MKDHLKNPNVYYIAVPVIAAIWALTAGFISYPNSVQNWQDEKEEYEKSLDYIQKIVEIQPTILNGIDKTSGTGEFDFSKSVDTFAQVFGITPSKYSLNVRKEVKKAGKKARPATMTIKEVKIETMAKFLSAMLAGWPELKCEVLSLEKAKVGKDNWKVDLSLTYYY